MGLGNPKIELDSSFERQEGLSSLKSHRHQVSVAMGSSASLERSEQNCDVDCKACDKDKGHERAHERGRECNHKAECGRPRERARHHDCDTGCDCSMDIKHGWSDEFGDSVEHHHSKEQWLHSQSPSCSHRCRHSHTPECFILPAPPALVFHSTPVTAPCCPSADLNAVHQSLDLSWESLPLAEGGSGDFEIFA